MRKIMFFALFTVACSPALACTEDEVAKEIELRQLEAQKRTIERYEIDVTTEKQEIEDRIDSLKSDISVR